MNDQGARVVARRFCAGNPVARVEHQSEGHIHDTWFVTTGTGGDRRPCEIVLQRLNDQVFPDCVLMMENVMRVAGHLRRRRPGRPAMAALAADDGSQLVYDSDGRPWRAFTKVPGAASHDVVATAEEAREVGRAFGSFFADVQDLPGPPLLEPIPGFKDFDRRRENFDFVVELDPFGRAATCGGEILDVRQHHRLAKKLVAAVEGGAVPSRIVHNDAKAANVLLDEATGEAVCVIDLDTVAPGTVLFDLGDVLRSATVTSPEDAHDLRALAVRDDLLEAALSGYLAEAGDLLTEGERVLLPLAGPLMAYESAVRFLTDHLAGDSYFRIERPRHNLERARAQLRVMGALEQASDRVAEVAMKA